MIVKETTFQPSSDGLLRISEEAIQSLNFHFTISENFMSGVLFLNGDSQTLNFWFLMIFSLNSLKLIKTCLFMIHFLPPVLNFLNKPVSLLRMIPSFEDVVPIFSNVLLYPSLQDSLECWSVGIQ